MRVHRKRGDPREYGIFDAHGSVIGASRKWYKNASRRLPNHSKMLLLHLNLLACICVPISGDFSFFVWFFSQWEIFLTPYLKKNFIKRSIEERVDSISIYPHYCDHNFYPISNRSLPSALRGISIILPARMDKKGRLRSIQWRKCNRSLGYSSNIIISAYDYFECQGGTMIAVCIIIMSPDNLWIAAIRIWPYQDFRDEWEIPLWYRYEQVRFLEPANQYKQCLLKDGSTLLKALRLQHSYVF